MKPTENQIRTCSGANDLNCVDVLLNPTCSTHPAYYNASRNNPQHITLSTII